MKLLFHCRGLVNARALGWFVGVHFRRLPPFHLGQRGLVTLLCFSRDNSLLGSLALLRVNVTLVTLENMPLEGRLPIFIVVILGHRILVDVCDALVAVTVKLPIYAFLRHSILFEVGNHSNKI